VSHAGLRVLQVVQKPQRRGAEVFARQLAAELARQGCEVATVYLYPYDGPGRLPLGPADTVLDGAEAHPAERLLGLHPRLLGRLRHAIRAFRPDVVQANGARTVKYAAAAKRRDHGDWTLVYRNIADPRQWTSGRRQLWFYRRRVFPAIDAVVGVSEMTLDGVRTLYPTGVPVLSLPRAVDPEHVRPSRSRTAVRSELGTPEASPVVLFVGSLTPDKRLDRLLRVMAAAREQEPDARLWVAGGGPLAADVETHPGAADGWVVPLGVREDVGDLLHAADLVLLTSDTEGMPGVLLEGAAAGLPVVATRVGGVPECVTDGETGVLVAPDDEQGLADAVVALVRDPALRRRMGEAGRARVLARYSLASVAASYLELYQRSVSVGSAGHQ
jgi:glycosyltransferase involved in cell wall biosynthesis